MEVKVYKRDNYNFIHTNMDNFKVNRLRFCFTKKFNLKDMIYLDLLPSILIHSTKKYNTNKKLNEKFEELYCPHFDGAYIRRGNNQTIEIDLSFINPRYTNKDMYKETFDMFNELLFNPNITDGRFDEEVFQMIKKQKLLSIDRIKQDGGCYGSFLADEIVYKSTPLEYNSLNLKKELEKITNKDLYNYYKNFLNDSKIDVLSIGNNDEEILVKYIDKTIKKIPIKDDLDSFDIILSKKSNILENIKSVKNNQSNLYVYFIIDELTDFEKNYVLYLYNFIFGSMNESMLFKCVREENNLCYSIYSYIRSYTNTLVVESGINYKNYKKCISLIKKVFKDMSNIKKIELLLEKAKNGMNLSLNDFYEMPNRILNYLYKIQYENIDNVEVRKEKYNSVTALDIVNLSKKIHLYSTFMLEGRSDINEEI